MVVKADAGSGRLIAVGTASAVRATAMVTSKRTILTNTTSPDSPRTCIYFGCQGTGSRCKNGARRERPARMSKRLHLLDGRGGLAGRIGLGGGRGGELDRRRRDEALDRRELDPLLALPVGVVLGVDDDDLAGVELLVQD